MKKKLFVTLLSGFLCFSSVPAFAADIDSMSLDELKEAYKELESKYNTLVGIKNPKEEPAETASADTSESTFEIDLSSGFYTPGVDIPYGTYDLTAVSGQGNVYSMGTGLNEIMGNPKDEYSIDSFNGASLNTGSVLSVSGNLVLHIKSNNAQVGNMKNRTVTSEVQSDFGAGNYTAGVEFPAGSYNIVATEGQGNVYSMEADLNEIMAPSPDEYSISQVNNVKFETGAVLEISGCSVRLIPVGE